MRLRSSRWLLSSGWLLSIVLVACGPAGPHDAGMAATTDGLARENPPPPTPPDSSPPGRNSSRCASGFADCDGNKKNGCETDLTTSVNHCGTCSTVCTGANGTPACVAGTCTVSACNQGFVQSGTTCVPVTRACTTTSGAAGTQTFDTATGTYGPCTATTTTCGTNETNVNGTCMSNTRSCSVPNGSGTATLNPADGTYGQCTATSCDAQYVLYGGACYAETRSCTTTGGSGTQTFNASTGQYGPCSETQCGAEYVLYNGQCVSRTEPCTVANGSGTRTFEPSTGQYGSCTIASCSAGYADCNASATDGCETSVTTCSDCGTCGNACLTGQVCSDGTCGAPPPPPTFVPQSCTTTAECVQNGIQGTCNPSTSRCIYVYATTTCP